MLRIWQKKSRNQFSYCKTLNLILAMVPNFLKLFDSFFEVSFCPDEVCSPKISFEKMPKNVKKFREHRHLLVLHSKSHNMKIDSWTSSANSEHNYS